MSEAVGGQMHYSKPKFSFVHFVRFYAVWILSPLAGWVAVFIVYDLLDPTLGTATITYSILHAAISGATFGALFSILPALAFGMPLQALLLKKGWTNPIAFALAGGGIALLAFGLLLVVTPLVFGLVVDPKQTIASMTDSWMGYFDPLLGLLFLPLTTGPISGAIFWLIRRPDRDARPRVDGVAKAPDVSAHG